MKRCLYRAQGRQGTDIEEGLAGALPELQERMARFGAQTLNLFQWEQQLFVYYECPHEAADPHDLFPHIAGWLADWPGEATERKWAPMMDIFHYQAPVSLVHWQRPEGTRIPYARVARLNPDYVASYIFYHYQYQEEKPGDGDKYGIIGLHENLLFFYCEQPTVIEEAPYKGKLDSSLTPADWGGTMHPHFHMWDQEAEHPNKPWLTIRLILQA